VSEPNHGCPDQERIARRRTKASERATHRRGAETQFARRSRHGAFREKDVERGEQVQVRFHHLAGNIITPRAHQGSRAAKRHRAGALVANPDGACARATTSRHGVRRTNEVRSVRLPDLLDRRTFLGAMNSK